MDDKTAKKWLAVIRRYADQLPDGYLKREFYEDIVQEIFCRFLSSYSGRPDDKVYISIRLHNHTKSYLRLLFRSLQKLCGRELLCAAVPRGIGMRAEWAEFAFSQGITSSKCGSTCKNTRPKILQPWKRISFTACTKACLW